ncbi:MAG: YcxB family protein [Gemmatimonadales bacterium]
MRRHDHPDGPRPPEGPPLEIEYEITREDLYAFQWRSVFGSPRGRRARRNVSLGWLLAVVLMAIVPAIGADGFVISRVSFTFIAIAVPVVFLFQWCLERWLARGAIRQLLNQERQDKGQLGKHRLVLDEEGIRESTAVGESRTRWAGVDRVEENADYIFIYTTPAAAHVIPKRAFTDPQQAEAFYQLSRARKADG